MTTLAYVEPCAHCAGSGRPDAAVPTCRTARDRCLGCGGSGQRAVTHLVTVQLSWGGLFDGRPHDGLVHLVRGTTRGTPGPLLCGIDHHAPDGPGFSVGGGISGPGVTNTPCDGCVAAARSAFAGLPITGMRELSAPAAAAAGHVIARDVVEPEASRLRRDAVNAEEHLWMRCQDALYGTPHNGDDAHHEIEPGAGR